MLFGTSLVLGRDINTQRVVERALFRPVSVFCSCCPSERELAAALDLSIEDAHLVYPFVVGACALFGTPHVGGQSDFCSVIEFVMSAGGLDIRLPASCLPLAPGIDGRITSSVLLHYVAHDSSQFGRTLRRAGNPSFGDVLSDAVLDEATHHILKMLSETHKGGIALAKCAVVGSLLSDGDVVLPGSFLDVYLTESVKFALKGLSCEDRLTLATSMFSSAAESLASLLSGRLGRFTGLSLNGWRSAIVVPGNLQPSSTPSALLQDVFSMAYTSGPIDREAFFTSLRSVLETHSGESLRISPSIAPGDNLATNLDWVDPLEYQLVGDTEVLAELSVELQMVSILLAMVALDTRDDADPPIFDSDRSHDTVARYASEYAGTAFPDPIFTLPLHEVVENAASSSRVLMAETARRDEAARERGKDAAAFVAEGMLIVVDNEQMPPPLVRDGPLYVSGVENKLALWRKGDGTHRFASAATSHPLSHVRAGLPESPGGSPYIARSYFGESDSSDIDEEYVLSGDFGEDDLRHATLAMLFEDVPDEPVTTFDVSDFEDFAQSDTSTAPTFSMEAQPLRLRRRSSVQPAPSVPLAFGRSTREEAVSIFESGHAASALADNPEASAASVQRLSRAMALRAPVEADEAVCHDLDTFSNLSHALAGVANCDTEPLSSTESLSDFSDLEGEAVICTPRGTPCEACDTFQRVERPRLTTADSPSLCEPSVGVSRRSSDDMSTQGSTDFTFFTNRLQSAGATFDSANITIPDATGDDTTSDGITTLPIFSLSENGDEVKPRRRRSIPQSPRHAAAVGDGRQEPEQKTYGVDAVGQEWARTGVARGVRVGLIDQTLGQNLYAFAACERSQVQRTDMNVLKQFVVDATTHLATLIALRASEEKDLEVRAGVGRGAVETARSTLIVLFLQALVNIVSSDTSPQSNGFEAALAVERASILCDTIVPVHLLPTLLQAESLEPGDHVTRVPAPVGLTDLLMAFAFPVASGLQVAPVAESACEYVVNWVPPLPFCDFKMKLAIQQTAVRVLSVLAKQATHLLFQEHRTRRLFDGLVAYTGALLSLDPMSQKYTSGVRVELGGVEDLASRLVASCDAGSVVGLVTFKMQDRAKLHIVREVLEACLLCATYMGADDARVLAGALGPRQNRAERVLWAAGVLSRHWKSLGLHGAALRLFSMVGLAIGNHPTLTGFTGQSAYELLMGALPPCLALGTVNDPVAIAELRGLLLLWHSFSIPAPVNVCEVVMRKYLYDKLMLCVMMGSDSPTVRLEACRTLMWLCSVAEEGRGSKLSRLVPFKRRAHRDVLGDTVEMLNQVCGETGRIPVGRLARDFSALLSSALSVARSDAGLTASRCEVFARMTMSSLRYDSRYSAKLFLTAHNLEKEVVDAMVKFVGSGRKIVVDPN